MAAWFAAGFADGRIIDVVLLLTLAEAAALVLWHRRTGRGPRAIDVLPNLGSGFCLMLALRVALGGGWWGWIAACLLGALAAHLVDLRRRWKA